MVNNKQFERFSSRFCLRLLVVGATLRECRMLVHTTTVVLSVPSTGNQVLLSANDYACRARNYYMYSTVLLSYLGPIAAMSKYLLYLL